MKSFGAVLGLLAALALLSLGLLLAPGPELNSVPGLFSTLWLLLTLLAVIAFAREAWRRDRLNRLRKRRCRPVRSGARDEVRSGSRRDGLPDEFIRQRERRSG